MSYSACCVRNLLWTTRSAPGVVQSALKKKGDVSIVTVVLCRPSGKDTPRAARRLNMGPDTPMEDCPPATPRSAQGPLSEEAEEREQDLQQQQQEEMGSEQPKRKKTGDEPPSRQASPEVVYDAGSEAGNGEEEEGVHEESSEDAGEQVLASQDSGMFKKKNICLFALSCMFLLLRIIMQCIPHLKGNATDLKVHTRDHTRWLSAQIVRYINRRH